MFILFDRMYERVRRTDGRTQHDGISRARIASRGKNWRSNKLSNFQNFLTKFWMAIAKLFSCKFYLNLLRCCYFMMTPCRVTVLPRDAASATYVVMRWPCLSVCLPVCHVRECCRIEKNKHICKKFSPSASHTVLVVGIECRRGRQKSRFWAGFTACCIVKAATGQVLSRRRRRTAVPHVVTIIAGTSGGVCWWRDATTKCLWQEVSTLRQIQQNSI